VNADTAAAALDELEGKWGQRYGAIIRLWRSAWAEFMPFPDYDVEICQVICSTNDRVAERPVPAGGQGPRSLPDRAGGAKVPLSGHQVPRPDREGPGPVDDAMETRDQRLRITFGDRFPTAETY